MFDIERDLLFIYLTDQKYIKLSISMKDDCLYLNDYG